MRRREADRRPQRSSKAEAALTEWLFEARDREGYKQSIKIEPEIRVVARLEQEMAAPGGQALEEVIRHSFWQSLAGIRRTAQGSPNHRRPLLDFHKAATYTTLAASRPRISRCFGGDSVELVRMLSVGDHDRHSTGETL